MENFDFVMIGSGIGGLTAASILAKEGYSVCVLEKNRQFGGCLQTFSRDKSLFDSGVHYLGGLDEGQNLYRYFNYLGLIGKLKLHRMDEDGFDHVSFEGDDKVYRHGMGYERFTEILCEDFPKSRKEIVEYGNTLRNMCATFPAYNLTEATGNEQYYPGYDSSAYEFFQRSISDPKLRDVLAGTVLLYAGDRHRSIMYQHAFTINSYIESSYKCVDGGSQITKVLTKNLRDMGAQLINYAEVKHLHSADRKIHYAELTDGRRIFAKNFISNVHPSVTLDMVGPEQVRKSYSQRIHDLRNAVSFFSLYLVFHPDTFPYLNHNLYHHIKGEPWDHVHYKTEDWPTAFMTCTPIGSKTNGYADSMTVMTYMHFEDWAEFKDSFSLIPQHEVSRGNKYEEKKQQHMEKLVEALERHYPGIKSKIKSMHASTPLTYRDYLYSPEGSVYGVVKDYNNLFGTLISHRTKISNLFLTGQNLNTHGILGSITSAVKAAGEFVGFNEVIRKINAVSGY